MRKKNPETGLIVVTVLAAAAAVWYGYKVQKETSKPKRATPPQRPSSTTPIDPVQPGVGSDLGTWSFEEVAAIPDPVIFVIRKDQSFGLSCDAMFSFSKIYPTGFVQWQDNRVSVLPEASWNANSFAKLTLICGATKPKTIWIMGA